MKPAPFPDSESYHSLIILANTDAFFEGSSLKHAELADRLQTYSVSGVNDIIFAGRAELYRTIEQLSRIPGIISSRVLILDGKGNEKARKAGKASGMLLLESRYGKTDEVMERLCRLEEVYAVYQARGVYSIVALAAFDDETIFKMKINDIGGIRHASLNITDQSIEPVEIEEQSQPISSPHYNSRNKYEGENYVYNEGINISYALGCIAMAEHLMHLQEQKGNISLAYAPLRGAKPILEVVLEALRHMQPHPDYFLPMVQFPVTSSFVSYPPNHPYVTKKGKKPASGRATNILELERLVQKNSEELAHMVYLDEIVSGGMLVGHIKEMVMQSEHPRKRGVLCGHINDGDITLDVLGLVHAHGAQFGESKRRSLLELQRKDRISFKEFPIDNLVTEDQRFLLGQHYLMYHFGPHVIPFIGQNREYAPEYHSFWRDVAETIEHYSTS